MRRYSKYGNQKVTVDDIKFDSKREASYYLYFKGLERAGTIWDLQLQTKLDFKIDNKKLFTYKPDFEYNDAFGHHYIDVKGVETPIFKLKKKIIEASYKIKIEVLK